MALSIQRRDPKESSAKRILPLSLYGGMHHNKLSDLAPSSAACRGEFSGPVGGFSLETPEGSPQIW
jgi:hypothetical protein